MASFNPSFSQEQLTNIYVCKEEQSHLPLQVEKRSLFYVTDELFESIVRTRYSDAVRCTEKEVEEIKQILGPEILECTTDSFLFEKGVNCTRCNRIINFYDVFLGAIKHHGVGFLKWAMFGHNKVQMFPKGAKQIIVCSNCGEIMTFTEQYQHYSAMAYASLITNK